MSINSPRRPWHSSISVPTWSLGVMISILQGTRKGLYDVSQESCNRCVEDMTFESIGYQRLHIANALHARSDITGLQCS